MAVAVILVLSWQPGWRPSGHHEVGLGLSANKKLAMRPNGFRITRHSPTNTPAEKFFLETNCGD
jgi:hypothetical protein